MVKGSKISLAMVGIVILLISCKGESPSSPLTEIKPRKVQRIVIVPSQPLPTKDEEAQSLVSVESGSKGVKEVPSEDQKGVEKAVEAISYDPRGRRDPFKPFVTKESVRKTDKSKPKTPLEKYNINDLKLIAIVWGIDRPTAMVEDPNGVGYVVKRGTLIGDKKGRVIRILKDKVFVRERFRDLVGNIQVNEVVLELHEPLEYEEGSP